MHIEVFTGMVFGILNAHSEKCLPRKYLGSLRDEDSTEIILTRTHVIVWATCMCILKDVEQSLVWNGSLQLNNGNLQQADGSEILFCTLKSTPYLGYFI